MIIKAKPSILILPKFKPKMWFLASWWYWISWLEKYKIFICKIMFLWGYSPLIYSQTSNWKSNSEIYNCKFIKQVVSRWYKRWKISVCWVCVFTQKGHIVDIVPYSQLCCLPYWFAEEHNCDMHPYSTKSHYVKYAGSFTSDYAINTTSSCVPLFHCHHQSLYWRKFLPKSTLNTQWMVTRLWDLMLHNWLKIWSKVYLQ